VAGLDCARTQGELMSLLLILAVGQDPTILSTRCSVLRSAGYLVKEASSVAECLHLFRDSDFDILLLCHSMPVEDRDRITRAVRSSGSRIPIYVVSPVSHVFTPGLADGVISSNPENLMKELERVLGIAPAGRARGGGGGERRGFALPGSFPHQLRLMARR
jgi:hypothetical protein